MDAIRRSIQLFALSLIICVTPLRAQEPAAGLDSSEKKSWLERQLSRYHGYSHLDRSYRLMAEQRDAEALAELDKYLRVEPASRAGRMSYLLVLYRLHAFDRIVTLPSDWFEADPDAGAALLYRALAHDALGDLSAAAADLRRAISLAQTTTEDRRFALRSIAQIELRRGDAPAAQQALEQLTGPDGAFQDYWQLGFAYEKQGLLAEADAAYWIAYARTHKPDEQLLALRAAAEVNRQQGRWRNADSALRLANKIAPRDSALLGALAENAFAAGRHADAAAWAERALARQPDAQLQTLLGYARFGLKDYDGAATAFAAALQSQTDDTARYPLYVALAQTELRARRAQAASEWLERALTIRPDDELRTQLAYLQFDAQRYDEAARNFAALANTAASPAARYRAYMALGQAHSARHDDAQAAAAFERAAEISPTPSALLAQGEALLRMGDLTQAAQLQARVAAHRDLSPDVKGDLYARQGVLLSQLNQHERAIAAFRLALANNATQRRAREGLAIALFQAGQWREASAEWRTLSAQRASAQGFLYLGLCYLRLDQPGLAIEALSRALPRADELVDTQQRDLHNALAYAFASEFQFTAAQTHWRASLDIQDDGEIRLRLAQSQRGAGELEAAAASLDAIDMFRLTPSLQAEVWDERGLIAAARKRWYEAANAAREAIQIAPTPSRRHRLGMYLSANHRDAEALAHYEAAVQADPRNSNYAATLGYAYLRLGRLADAARLFEQALEIEPDRLDLQRDIGYAYLHLGDNANAVMWLQRAVDSATVEPGTARDAIARTREARGLRETIARIDNRFDFTLYQINESREGEKISPTAPLGVGIGPSQGGVELAYQPSSLGFRDERILQVYTRVLWSTLPDSDAIFDDETLQGGIGARYKPLRSANLVLSGERRFAIGDGAADDWLLRAAYSWSLGETLPVGVGHDRYAWLYVDGAYAFGQSDAGLFYGEYREGVSFNFGDIAYVSPHVLLSTRAQANEVDDIIESNAGVGVSARLHFGDTRYRAGQGVVELLLQSTVSLSGDGSGWRAMGMVRF